MVTFKLWYLEVSFMMIIDRPVSTTWNFKHVSFFGSPASSELETSMSTCLQRSIDKTQRSLTVEPITIPGNEETTGKLEARRKESLTVSAISGKGPWNLFSPPSPATSCGMNEYSELGRAVSMDETPEHLQLSRDSSPHETPTENNRETADHFSFSDSMQHSASYSRHRRALSRDTTKLSQSLVATPMLVTLTSKRPSRNQSPFVKENEDSVSETAAKSILYLIDKLGPRITAKNIVTGLLAQTVQCFETAKTPDLVHIGRYFGSLNFNFSEDWKFPKFYTFWKFWIDWARQPAGTCIILSQNTLNLSRFKWEVCVDFSVIV